MKKVLSIIMILFIISCLSACDRSVSKMAGSSNNNWSDTKVHEEQFEKGDEITFQVKSKIKDGTLVIRLLGNDNREIINFDTDTQLKETYTFEETENCKIEIIGDKFNGSYKVEWSVDKD